MPLGKVAVDRCPVCEQEPGEVWTTGQDYESWTCEDIWTVRHCPACRHLWLDPRPAESELDTIYPPTYYAYSYEEKISRIARKAKEILDARKFLPLLALMPRKPTNYLDIGCGSGRYLRMMRDRGLDPGRIYGLELDEQKTAKLRAEGFRVFSQRVEDCQELEPDSFDLVTMFHVLEHVENPGAVLRKIARSLTPDGLLILETPNFESLDSGLFKHRYWGGYHFPRHWNIFSPNSLGRLLQSSGFKVVEQRFQTGHAFWMWSFHNFLIDSWKAPRLGSLFNPLEGFLPFLAAFTAFDLVRSRMGCKTSAMLFAARRL